MLFEAGEGRETVTATGMIITLESQAVFLSRPAGENTADLAELLVDQ